MVLVFPVILQDNVIKRSYDFTSRIPTRQRDFSSGDMLFLVCHVISQDYLIERSCEFMGRSPLIKVATLTGLVATGIVIEEIFFLVD